MKNEDRLKPLELGEHGVTFQGWNPCNAAAAAD